MEPADAKDLIDEAIERAEENASAAERVERDRERRFRDRISLMVGGFAVALAIVHMGAAGAQRDSLLQGIAASDSFAYMQAKIVRETVLKTAAAQPTAAAADRAAWAHEATRLRTPDAAGHAIGQLETAGARQREAGEIAARRGEGFELGETALQLAIVLLSIAMVARSKWIAGGASIVAAVGVVLAVAASLGFLL
ncbi:DUF4337 family protein [Sphingomonas sp. PAMC 26617]|uniref:DUF4337 family protein n=1 Tax=Sphingomonas sp. PAMC 26617 TaxID=1112216 RepID=UPI000288C26F|nr:DUF4337 family protein [Sphingomonas sp. PAMC 26617]